MSSDYCSEYGGGGGDTGEWIKQAKRARSTLSEKKDDFMTLSCSCSCFSSPPVTKRKVISQKKCCVFLLHYFLHNWKPTTLSWILILLFFSHLQSLQFTFSSLSFIFIFSPCHPIWQPKFASTCEEMPKITIDDTQEGNLQSVETETPNKFTSYLFESFQRPPKPSFNWNAAN